MTAHFAGPEWYRIPDADTWCYFPSALLSLYVNSK